MSYLFLSLAIIAEIIGTTLLKASYGFTKASLFIAGLICFMIALFFMTLSFKTIPLSVGYAIWSGVGTAGAAVIGYTIWYEKLGAINYAGMFCIVIGVVLLNVSTIK